MREVLKSIKPKEGNNASTSGGKTKKSKEIWVEQDSHESILMTCHFHELTRQVKEKSNETIKWLNGVIEDRCREGSLMASFQADLERVEMAIR